MVNSELFSNINTCNGIIENGTAANLSDALLAEAYFFRAFDYFILVQTYGGVPLDLGSGKLKFNTTTNRTSVRNTVPEVYEVYLIAAEAAVKLGKNTDAYNLVKVLRERAGKQTYSQNDKEAVSVDKSAEMVAATPATITIDFILDERSREFWGEGYRWFDLVRTQKWAERASVYHIAGDGFTDKDLKEVHRDIPAGYYIRPIPQSQLDGMEMTAEEKTAYQNPAYQ